MDRFCDIHSGNFIFYCKLWTLRSATFFFFFLFFKLIFIFFFNLQSKIMYFRVSDLQLLLSHYDLNKNGKKTDLQRRAYNLIENEGEDVFNKIEEIYKQQQLSTLSCTPGIPNQTIMYQQQQQQQPQQQQQQNQLHVNNGVLAYQNIGATSNYPVHPDVRLKKLAFFDNMGTLLKPSTLIPNGQNRVNEQAFQFHLTPTQATEIASHRDMRNTSKPEHVVQVQLRFCLLETSCEQDDHFPPNVTVKVNNKACPLPVSLTFFLLIFFKFNESLLVCLKI